MKELNISEIREVGGATNCTCYSYDNKPVQGYSADSMFECIARCCGTNGGMGFNNYHHARYGCWERNCLDGTIERYVCN